jgi:hypothetical protein
MKLGGALASLRQAELDLARLLREVADRQAAEVDVHHLAKALAEQCDAHAQRLAPIVERYGDGREEDEFLADLRELYLAAQRTTLAWTVVNQGAQAARDRELLELASELSPETEVQTKWVLTKTKEAAPQALTS